MIYDALKPYLYPDNLRMVFHPHTTQSNESLNTSVSDYIPKHKHYSTSKSLETRVGVVAAIQISGYRCLLNNLYGDFDLNFDIGLPNALSKLDTYKNVKEKEPQR